MKTSELTGAALDWAVAKCEPDDTLAIYFDDGEPLCRDDWSDNQEFKPSTDWSQGGVIIEREKISLKHHRENSYDLYAGKWEAGHPECDHETGDTPLIAAMRCYVASILGDEVDIPKELQ